MNFPKLSLKINSKKPKIPELWEIPEKIVSVNWTRIQSNWIKINMSHINLTLLQRQSSQWYNSEMGIPFSFSDSYPYLELVLWKKVP